MCNSQFGVKEHHNTSHAITYLVNLITPNLDKSERVISTFLEISKAFDSLEHNILLPKVYDYGFRCPIHSWYTSFKTNHFSMCLSYWY